MNIGDLEIIPGWRLSVFPWWMDLIVLSIFIIVIGCFYALFVWLFSILKLKSAEYKTYNVEIKRIRALRKEDKKEALKDKSNAFKRVFWWKKSKKVLIPISAILLVVCLLAVPTLTVTFDYIFLATQQNGQNLVVTEASKLAFGEAKENIVTIQEEGCVLLKNDNSVLPLNVEQNNKINIFGSSAFGMFYGGGGSGIFVTNATYNGKDFHAKRLEQAFVDEGFEYNRNLYNLVANYYESSTYKITDTNYDISCQINTYNGNAGGVVFPTCRPYDHEPEASAYTKTYAGLDGKTLLESAKEYSDTALYVVSRAGSEDVDFNRSQLQFTAREQAMINLIKDNFEKVIILINTGNVMECGLLEDEKVDSVMWVGQPGLTGNTGVVKCLDGKVSPSGHTVDTWVYDISTMPSYQSFGNDTTMLYSNNSAAFVEYLEGIYVGYRYYETRAHDDPTFKYEDYVQYPFGYGLSYTSFDKYIESSSVNFEEQKVNIKVNVKNTGEVDGKEVIQLYKHTPYTGKVEKPSTELVKFVKTPTLKPEETYQAEIEITFRELANWNNAADVQAYFLDKGDYAITLNENSHELAKEVSGKTNSITFNLANEIVYKKSYQTNYYYKSLFSEAEYGPSSEAIKYLTRSDWANSFPSTSKINRAATSKVISATNNKKSYADNQIHENAPQTDVDYGDDNLTLRDLKNAPANDPRWEQLLNQMSKVEMCNLVNNGGFQTAGVNSINKRMTSEIDGPASIYTYGTGHNCEVVVASTWNVECAKLLAMSICKEGATMGISGWYAPGINIHRCATGGRNFEYFSEDPLITGLMGAAEAQGAAKYGVYTIAKHFAVNEQENNRQRLSVWANEQSLREIYLRPFELYTDGGGLAYMSSFSRIGPTWTGACESLCTTICRNEWGFNGFILTDWVNAGYMFTDEGLRGGNDLWLYRCSTYTANDALNATPHDALILLRRACKHILYTAAHSNCVWTEDDYLDVGLNISFADMNWSVYENK